MSKYILRKRFFGFTTVSNTVINALKNDLVALGLYTYLLSLPDDWEFYKTVLCKTCKVGIKKLEAKFKVLKSYGLIDFGQERNEKGQFENFFMEIFDKEQLNEPENEQNQPVGQNCRTVETVRRSGEATKKEIPKKDLKIQKRERSLSVNDFKTQESIQLCTEKNLTFELELKKFTNHYQGKEISVGKFLNWLERAKPESKQTAKNDSLDDYVYRLMRDTGITEEAAREHYRQRGHI